MVFFGVPVILIESLSIFDIFIGILFINCLEVIILSAILLVQILEPLSSVKMFPRTVLLSMMFIPVQEVIVVSVILKLLSYSLLLFLSAVLHPIST